MGSRQSCSRAVMTIVQTINTLPPHFPSWPDIFARDLLKVACK